MTYTIEHTIRIKIVLICLTVVLACGFFLFFIQHARDNTDKQLEINDRLQEKLELTHDLIREVNETQSMANRLISTQSSADYRRYKTQTGQTMALADSLNHIFAFGPDTLVLKINALLNQQVKLLGQLQRQQRRENPVTAITKTIEETQPVIQSDSQIIINQTQKLDTLINKKPGRGFFRKLAGLFASDKDSIITVIHHQTDTVLYVKPDTLAVLSTVDSVAREASAVYEKQLYQLTRQTNRVMMANQEIAQQITTLLIALHKESLDASLQTTLESEENLKQSNRYAMLGGAVALLLILLFFILIMLDINQAKKDRKALIDSEEQTRRLMESRHQLLLSVSHDMKTPLNTISGTLQLHQPEATDRHAMKLAAQYLQALLENLMDYSELERGSIRLSVNRFDPQQLYQEVCSLFYPVAQQKGIALITGYEVPQKLLLCSDSLKIRQICINLLSNAFKYTAEGEVHFKLACRDDKLLIRIQDSGVGIPASMQARIFAPFERLDQGRQMADGHGFGMSVVRGLTDLFGGTITLHSAAGKGSLVRSALPWQQTAPLPDQGRNRRAGLDDDRAFLKMTCELLTQLGHEVTGYTAPVPPGVCDIILTDWEMHHFSGETVLQQAGETPVWLMTGRHDFPEEAVKAKGFQGLIRKPFSVQDLRLVFGEAPASLENMLEGDEELISAVKQLFLDSTAGHISELNRAVQADDFETAAAICHKMYGMSAQLGYNKLAAALRETDERRNAPFEGWQQQINRIIREALSIMQREHL